MSSFFRRITGTGYPRPQNARRRATAPLALEPLEDRTVPTPFVVTTAQDTINNTDGLLSLREALILTNQNPDSDTISFQPGIGGTIQLNLPVAQFGGQLNISNPVTIQGPSATQLIINQ